MTETDVKKLWDKYHVPAHIRRHMARVADVCNFLTAKIRVNSPEVAVNKENLNSAALLHDIAKIVDINEASYIKMTLEAEDEDTKVWQKLRERYRNIDHAHAGADILEKEGAGDIAMIVKKHGFTALVATLQDDRPSTIEEKILYYADKRVMHEEIVSLKKRLHDGRLRYFPDGKIPDHDAEVEKALFKLEKELCGLAGIEPSSVDTIE